MVGRRIAYLLIAVLATLVAAAPATAQDKKKKRPPKPVEIQLLSINDFHGHLDSSLSGTVTRTGDPADRVPAGGAEYLATHIRMLRHRNPHTLLVAAGDLVGGSPLLSSLFHDEPAIEVMNKLGMYVSAVGNHEFDEGQAELRRMQRGGCHPTDGCRDGNGFSGAHFRYLAANVDEQEDRPALLPGVRGAAHRGRQDRLHRHDAEGHAAPGVADQLGRPAVPRRGPDREQVRPLPAQAPRRARDRRAAARGRVRGQEGRRRRRLPGPERADRRTSSGARRTTSTCS